MDEVTVMVVDEQPYFRTGVLRALSKQAGFKVIECDIAADALALIDGYLPGVVLLGADLATLSALDLGREIGQRYPNTKIIILSPSPSDEEIFEVLGGQDTVVVHNSGIAVFYVSKSGCCYGHYVNKHSDDEDRYKLPD